VGVGEDCIAGEGTGKAVLVDMGCVTVGLAVGESEVLRTCGDGKTEGLHAPNVPVSRQKTQMNLNKDL